MYLFRKSMAGWSRRRRSRAETMPENTCGVSYDDLPGHLMMSVLAMLSPRDVLISMAVCKTWRAMIWDDPDRFAYMHLKHSRRRACGSIADDDEKAGLVIVAVDSIPAMRYSILHFLEFLRHRSFTFDGVICDAVISCDGLVLLSARDGMRPLLLWNPAIRKIKSVPPAVAIADVVVDRCDLWRGPVGHPQRLAVGMGCIEYNNKYDYKMVQIYNFKSLNVNSFPPCVAENIHVLLYSLSSHSWRRIEAIPPCNVVTVGEYGVFCVDSVHWQAKSREIIGFDLREEVFWQAPTPTPPVDQSWWFLAVFEGSLGGVMRYVNQVGESVVEVWAMKEHRMAASWSKLSVYVGRTSRFLRPVGCLKNGKALLERRFEKVVVCHDPNIKRMPDAMVAEGLTIYSESLALLDDEESIDSEGRLDAGRRDVMHCWASEMWRMETLTF